MHFVYIPLVSLFALLFLLCNAVNANPVQLPPEGAVPTDGSCVLCWGGPDGLTQLGYSHSGKCREGEPDAHPAPPQYCTGNDLTK